MTADVIIAFIFGLVIGALFGIALMCIAVMGGRAGDEDGAD